MLTFEPDPSHYQSCGALATCCEGAGSVHLARHLPSGNLVALKKFNMERAGDDAALVQHEVRLTRQLRHPHVLGLHAAFVAGPHVVAVLPLMAFGSCRDLLNAHFANGLPEAAVACVLSDALLGLEYIHRRGIVHRAVRASHILVSGSGRACLSGLRYSCPLVENGRWQKALHSFPQSTARNLNWLSPEVLEQNLQGYNEKSDVYSLGVTACELANGAIPFADMPTTLMLTEKVRGCCPQLLDCSTVAECDDDGPGTNEGNGGSGSDAGLLHHGADTLNIREGAGSGRIECAEVVTEYAQRRFSDAFHQMTELCLQRDPVQRPAASQLLQHPFFKNARRTGSGTCSLPELLHPVMPLGDRHVATQDISFCRSELPSSYRSKLAMIRREYEIFFQNFPWGRYVRPSGPQDPPTTKYARYFEPPMQTQALPVDTKCHRNLPKPRTISRDQGHKVPEPEDLGVGGNLRRQRALSNLNIPGAIQENHNALYSDQSVDPRNYEPVLKSSPISERDAFKISLNRDLEETQSRLRGAQMKVFLGEFLDRNSRLTDRYSSEDPGGQKAAEKKTVVLRYPKFLGSRDLLKSAPRQDFCSETLPKEKLKSLYKDPCELLNNTELFEAKCPVSATNVELKHVEFLSKEFLDYDAGKIKESKELKTLPKTESHSDVKIPKSAALNIEISRYRGAIPKQKPVRPYSTDALAATLSEDLRQHTAVPKLRILRTCSPSLIERETLDYLPGEKPLLENTVSKGEFEYSELPSQELLYRNAHKIKESGRRKTLIERVTLSDEEPPMSGTRNIDISRQQGAIPKQKQSHTLSTEMLDTSVMEDVRPRHAVSKERPLHGHSQFFMSIGSPSYLPDEDSRQGETVSKRECSFFEFNEDFLCSDTRNMNEAGEQATTTEYKTYSDEKPPKSETRVRTSSEKLERTQYRSFDVKSGTSKKTHDSTSALHESTSCGPLYTGAIPKQKISHVYLGRDSDSDVEYDSYRGCTGPMSETRLFHAPARYSTRDSNDLVQGIDLSLTVEVRRKAIPVDFKDDIRESKPIASEGPRYFVATPKRKTRRSSLDKLDRSKGALSLFRTSHAPTDGAGVPRTDPLLSEAARRPFIRFRSDDDMIKSATSKDPHSPSAKIERDDTSTDLDSDSDNDDSKPDRGSEAVKLLRRSRGRTCMDWNDIARRINPLLAEAILRRKTPTSLFVNNNTIDTKSAASKDLHSSGAIRERKSSKQTSRIRHFPTSARSSQTRFIKQLSRRRSRTFSVDKDDIRDSQNSAAGRPSATSVPGRDPGLRANDVSDGIDEYVVGVYPRYVLGVLRPSDSPYYIDLISVREGKRRLSGEQPPSDEQPPSGEQPLSDEQPPSGKQPPPGEQIPSGDQPHLREPEPNCFQSTGPNDASGKIPIFDFLPSDLTPEEVNSDSSDSFFDIDPPLMEPVQKVNLRNSLWVPRHVRRTRHVRNLVSEYWRCRRRDARRMANVFRNWKFHKNSNTDFKRPSHRGRTISGSLVRTSNSDYGFEERVVSIPLTDPRKIDAYIRSLDRLINSDHILKDPTPIIDGHSKQAEHWQWSFPTSYYLPPIPPMNVDTENTASTCDGSSETEDLTRIFNKLGNYSTLSDPPMVISDHSTQVCPSSLPTCPHSDTAEEHTISTPRDDSLQSEDLTRLVPKLENDKLADPSPVIDGRPTQSGLRRLPLPTGYYLPPDLFSDSDTQSTTCTSVGSRQRSALNRKSQLVCDHKLAGPTQVIDGRRVQNASERLSLPIRHSESSEERTVYTSRDVSRQTETLTRTPRLHTGNKLPDPTPIIGGHLTQPVPFVLSLPANSYLPSHLYSDSDADRTPNLPEDSAKTEYSARILHKLDNTYILNDPPTVISNDRTQVESCPMSLPTSSHSDKAEECTSTSCDDSRVTHAHRVSQVNSEHKLTDATLVIGGYRTHSVTRRLSMPPGYYLPPGLFNDSDTESIARSSCDNYLQRACMTRQSPQLDDSYNPSPVIDGRRTKDASQRLRIPTCHFWESGEEHTASTSSDDSRSSVIVTRVFPQLNSDHKLADLTPIIDERHTQVESGRLSLRTSQNSERAEEHTASISCDDSHQTVIVNKIFPQLDNDYKLTVDRTPVIDGRHTKSVTRPLSKTTGHYSLSAEEHTSLFLDASRKTKPLSKIFPRLDDYELSHLSPVIDGRRIQATFQRSSLPIDHLSALSGELTGFTSLYDSRQRGPLTRICPQLDRDHKSADPTYVIDRRTQGMPQQSSLHASHYRDKAEKPVAFASTSRYDSRQIASLARKSSLQINSAHYSTDSTTVSGNRRSQNMHQQKSQHTNRFISAGEEMTPPTSSDDSRQTPVNRICYLRLYRDFKLAHRRTQAELRRRILRTGYDSDRAGEHTVFPSRDDYRPRTSPSRFPFEDKYVSDYRRLGLDDLIQQIPWARYLPTYPFNYVHPKTHPPQVQHSELPHPRHTGAVSRRTALKRPKNDSIAQTTASPCRNSHRRRTKSRLDVSSLHLDRKEATAYLDREGSTVYSDREESTEEQVAKVDPRCKSVKAGRHVSSSASRKATTRPRQRRLASILWVLVGCFGRVRACVKQEPASKLDSRRKEVSQVRHVHFNLDSVREAHESSSNGNPYHAEKLPKRQRTPSIIVFDRTTPSFSARRKHHTSPRRRPLHCKKSIRYRRRIRHLRRPVLHTLVGNVPCEYRKWTPVLDPHPISLFQRSLYYYEECNRAGEPVEESSSIENDSDIEYENSVSSEGSK